MREANDQPLFKLKAITSLTTFMSDTTWWCTITSSSFEQPALIWKTRYCCFGQSLCKVTLSQPTLVVSPWIACSKVPCPIVALFLHRDGPSTATRNKDRYAESTGVYNKHIKPHLKGKCRPTIKAWIKLIFVMTYIQKSKLTLNCTTSCLRRRQASYTGRVCIYPSVCNNDSYSTVVPPWNLIVWHTNSERAPRPPLGAL